MTNPKDDPYHEEVVAELRSKGKKAQGKRELLRWYTDQSKPLSRKAAILAWCYHCQGYYDGGLSDCEDAICPLYPYMPYSHYVIAPQKRSEKQQRVIHQMQERKREIEGLNEENR